MVNSFSLHPPCVLLFMLNKRTAPWQRLFINRSMADGRTDLPKDWQSHNTSPPIFCNTGTYILFTRVESQCEKKESIRTCCSMFSFRKGKKEASKSPRGVLGGEGGGEGGAWPMLP